MTTYRKPEIFHSANGHTPRRAWPPKHLDRLVGKRCRWRVVFADDGFVHTRQWDERVSFFLGLKCLHGAAGPRPKGDKWDLDLIIHEEKEIAQIADLCGIPRSDLRYGITAEDFTKAEFVAILTKDWKLRQQT